VLILAIIAFGMIVGAAAQWVLGRTSRGVDWGLALVAGLVGSFVGGLLLSLLFGDGIELRASGLIGSFIGAVIVTWLWLRFGKAKSEPATTARRR
jgi:uncharacterized membrane protein YeaQ/YmgE (transglycosylase-associated protein family)